MLKTETLVKEYYTAEAAQIPDEATTGSYMEVYNWIVDIVESEDPDAAAPSITLDPKHGYVAVHLEDRLIRANAGDWLIRVKGSFHRISDEIYRLIHDKKEV